MKKFDYIVYIGRFQPLHAAHVATIERALSLAQKVIIFVGSANQPRTIKNPFTWKEREAMILSSFNVDVAQNNLVIRPLEDAPYNNQTWAKWVQSSVDEVISMDVWKSDYNVKIGIIGYAKDNSSFYLKMFPQWEFIPMGNIDHINATDVREAFFNSNSHKWNNTKDIVPSNVYEWMNRFEIQNPAYKNLIDEFRFLRNYKLQWEGTPYPVTFVTVDACVIQSGHVLMVRRGAMPGKGSLALPGGFIHHNERLEDSMIRELREETKLKVPEPVLRGSIKATKVFDAPERSLRGRTITHAFLLELASGELPKVKGGDDAEKATWIPLNTLDSLKDQIFEDHRAIILTMVGYL